MPARSTSKNPKFISVSRCSRAIALIAMALAATSDALGQSPDSPASDPSPQERVVASRKAYWHGAYDDATRQYEALTSEASVGAEARIGWARCLLATGKYAEARSALDALDAKDARSGEAALLRAEIEQAVGNYEAALAFARVAHERQPRNGRARLLVAELLELLGERDEAIKLLAWFERLLVRQVPTRPEDMVAAGQGLYRYMVRTRDVDLANRTRYVLNQLFQMAYARVDPDYWPARIAAADLLRTKYNLAEAREDYLAALAINSNAVAAHVGLGHIALEDWEFEEVDRHVSAALAVNTHSVEALNLRAEARLTERRYVEASAVADQAMAVNPNSIPALALKASALYSLGLDGEAETFVARGEQVSPRNWKLYTMVGDALGALRRFEQSEAAYRKAIACEPSEADPLIALGTLCMQWGEEGKARDALTAAWKLDDFNELTRNTIDLLDRLDRFARIDTPHYSVRYDPEHDQVVATLMARHLDSVYDSICARFNAKLARKAIIEIFPTHAEFGVRIHGKPWIHTVGACTGWVIAMDAPRSGGDLWGAYDYADVLTHEFTHTVTLAVTDFRIPHWFTEGLAVWVENQPRSYEWKELLADAVRRDELYPIDSINWGFMRPRKPTGRQQAYAQAEWMCAYLVETFGEGVINRMLEGFAAGKTQAVIVREITGADEATFDRKFADWAKQAAREWGFDLSPPESIDALTTQLAARDASADLYARLAIAELDAGDWEKGKASAQQGLELDAQHQAALDALVRCNQVALLEHLHDPLGRVLAEQALAPAKQLLELDGDNRYALATLASVYWQREEKEAARPYLQKLDQVWPIDPFPAGALGTLLHEAEEFDQAFPYLEKAARLSAHPGTFAFLLGDIHERQNRLAEARVWYTQALHTDATREETHVRLAQVAMRLGDLATAADHYRLLCILSPRSAEYHLQCALAYRKLGKPELMREHAQRAVELDPQSSASQLLRD